MFHVGIGLNKATEFIFIDYAIQSVVIFYSNIMSSMAGCTGLKVEDDFNVTTNKIMPDSLPTIYLLIL